MMQYEKADALGPLDEDDSDVEDEENEDDNDEYVDEETEGEGSDGEYGASDDGGDDTYQSSRNFSSFNATGDSALQNNFSLNNLNDSNSVAFVAEEKRPNTVETFCNTTVPTIEMFNALEDNDKVVAFQTFLHVSPMPFKLLVLTSFPIRVYVSRAFPKKITSCIWYSPY